MNLPRPFRQLVSAKPSANSARQQERTSWQNLVLCVVGLVISFICLLQSNPMGWLFLLGFGFFLIMQASPKVLDDE